MGPVSSADVARMKQWQVWTLGALTISGVPVCSMLDNDQGDYTTS